MEIDRKDVILYLSISKLLNLKDKEQKENILLDVGDDYDEKNINSSLNSSLIIKYFQHSFVGMTNEYLSNLLFLISRKKIKVVGEVEKLYPCKCCGYRTLERISEYDICAVCGWEDDGTTDTKEYSNPNGMTLEKAKSIFMEEITSHKIDDDILNRYEKNVPHVHLEIVKTNAK